MVDKNREMLREMKKLNENLESISLSLSEIKDFIIFDTTSKHGYQSLTDFIKQKNEQLAKDLQKGSE